MSCHRDGPIPSGQPWKYIHMSNTNFTPEKERESGGEGERSKNKEDIMSLSDFFQASVNHLFHSL